MTFWSVKGLKWLTDASYVCERASWFCVLFNIFLNINKTLKRGTAFTAVKRDANFLTWHVKGVPFVNRGYTKMVPFLSKMVYKRERCWT